MALLLPMKSSPIWSIVTGLVSQTIGSGMMTF